MGNAKRIARQIVAVYAWGDKGYGGCPRKVAFGDARMDEATAIIQEFVDRTDYSGMSSTHERARAFLRGDDPVLETGADDIPNTSDGIEEQWARPTVEPGNRRRRPTAGDTLKGAS